MAASHKRLVRMMLGGFLLAALNGCSTMSPRDALATLDPRNPLYDTEDCRQARRIAERFEGRDLARGGAGVAAGVVVGVVAAPIVGAIEADAVAKKEAVISRLKQACEGPIIIDSRDPNRKPILPERQRQSLEDARQRDAERDLQESRGLPIEERLRRLEALRTQGLISQAEFEGRRRQILSGL